MVKDVLDQPFGISWSWNDLKLKWLRDNNYQGGLITAMGNLNLVDTITIDTNVSIGEVKLIFGTPDIEILDTNQWKQVARYFSAYDKYGLSTEYYISCNLLQPFHSPTDIAFDNSMREKPIHKNSLKDIFRIC